VGVLNLWGDNMEKEDELVLKVTKEIVIKYIEIGRLSVNSFDEIFRQIHETVHDSFLDRRLSKK
jgi:hypothetical protein